jgi:hypothetical protein
LPSLEQRDGIPVATTLKLKRYSEVTRGGLARKKEERCPLSKENLK